MQVIAPPAPHVVAIELSGKITRKQVQDIMVAIERKLETQPRVSILIDLTGMTGITAAALLQDFKSSLENLTRLHRFYRVASVADSNVLSLLSDLDGEAFGGLELKNFKPEQYDSALSWVAQRPSLPESGVETSKHSKDNILEIRVEDEVSAFDLDDIKARIHACYQQAGPVKMLIRVPTTPSQGVNFWLQKWQSLNVLQLISHVAVIGDKSLRPLVDGLNMAVQASLHHFEESDHLRALGWLSEAPDFLQTFPTSRPSLLSFRLNGKVTELDIRGVTLTIVSRLKGENSLDVLIEIPHYDGTSLKAILQTLHLGSIHLDEMVKGIRRVALITDSQWLTKALHLEDILFSGIQERSFPFDRREEALRWLNEGRS